MRKREIAKSWANRTLLTARAGLSAAKVAGRTALDRTFEEGLTDVDALVDRLDELKGLSLKVGQMASLAQGPLPPAVAAALARLQSKATGLPPEVVREVLLSAYGSPVEEIFERFEDEPFAAASIGQVHRAWVGERPVAVKIQYPGIEEAISHDLRNFTSLRFLLAATSFGAGELTEEIAVRLREECDYRIEAAHQQRFAAALAHRSDVVVPGVLTELVRKEVLVTELQEAKSFSEFRDTATDAQRSAAGVTLFAVAFWAIFAVGLFNGDPHPGNYLFRPDGKVALLDFGCVRAFSHAHVSAWRRFARSILDGDRAAFPDAARDMGLVGSQRFDFDAAWETFRLIYTPMRQPRFRFDPDFSRRSFEALSLRNPNLLRIRIPPQLAFSWRLNWGLFSVLADLRAEGDFGTPFREAIESPMPDLP